MEPPAPNSPPAHAQAPQSGLRLSDEELATRPSALAAGLLKDCNVVISGAGSGIGRATAWLAARLGAHVMICGRTLEKLLAVRAALTDRGLPCEAFALDIRDRGGVDRFFDEIFTRRGKLDLLVNCAGGQFPQAAIDFTEKGWRAVIDTNLNGTFHMMQSAAHHWRALSQPGSIVSLVVSPRGLHQVAHTVAARAGVMAFTEAVAVEWAPLCIRVNCVAPGAIVSEGWAAYPQDIHRRYREASPLRLAGSPWHIAETVLFVGGPAGTFMTGQTVHVNGGTNLWGETWTAGKPAWFAEASRAWQEP